MRAIYVILTLLSFGNLFSQDLNCLDYKLYNSDSDAVQLQNLSDSENGAYKTESLQLVVLPTSYSEFPVWASYKRNGIDTGFKIVLINNTSNELSLFNTDGKIIIKRQVYVGNEWKDVKSYDKTLQPNISKFNRRGHLC